MLAIGVAEVVAPAILNGLREPVRELVVALARAGVTATCSMADGPRYGSIDVDSNLPDFRIALGGPAQNPFTRQLLAAASPAVTAELAGTAGRHGRGPGLGARRARAGRGPSPPEPTCAGRGTCRCSSWPPMTSARRSRRSPRTWPMRSSRCPAHRTGAGPEPAAG